MSARVVACAVVLSGVVGLGISAAPNTVKVDGGQIAGATAAGVRVFKGIPFAAPPVGELRWKAPQPGVACSGVRAADTSGPQCMQQPYPCRAPYASAPQP